MRQPNTRERGWQEKKSCDSAIATKMLLLNAEPKPSSYRGRDDLRKIILVVAN